MQEKMAAAVLYGPGQLVIEEVARPSCGPEEVLLRVKAVGLCGSDIRTITCGYQNLQYPQIIGHEIAGEVVAAGANTNTFQVGDRVYVGSIVPCYTCESCRRGWHGQCENLIVPGTDIPGGYAEYMVLTKDVLARGTNMVMPDDLSYEEAVLVEPLSSVYACQKHADITLGDIVVVIGAGPAGCLHIEMAKLRGAACVIAVEKSALRLDMARDFGADYLVDASQPDVVRRVKDITGGRGADKVIAACPSAAAQQQAVEMACKRGAVIWFGGIAEQQASINTNTVHYNLLTVYGHYGYNSRDLEEAYRLLSGKFLNAKKYISHVLPLAEIEAAIELAKAGEAIKIVLVPGG